MSDITNPSTESTYKYYLEDQERWEELGFDWESWNRTVERILQQHSTVRSSIQE